MTGRVVQNNNYEQAISTVGEQREEECVRAIKEIDGNRLEAYFALLDVYRNRGRFDQEESLQISGLLNSYYKGDTTDPEYLELCYEIGYLYFNFYTENGSEGFAQRASHANEYFKKINDAVTEHPDIELPENMAPWKSYYRLSELFKTTTGLSLDVSRTDEELRELLEEVSACIASMGKDSNYTGNDADSIRLSQASYFANQLNDLRNEFVAAGVSKEEVLSVMREIRASEESVTLHQLDQKKADALAECDDFIDNISAAYEN